jgi:hypothetical protein
MSIRRASSWLLIAGLAACAPAKQVVVVQKEGPADEPDVPSVPTAEDFGVSFEGDVPADWKRYGMLQCENEKRETCAVANMPLLGQLDHRLVAPLKAYVQKFADAKGEVTWLGTKGASVVTVDHAVHGTLDNGCWLTSQTTLIETAMANRPELALTGRAVVFHGLGGDSALELPQQLHRLLWQYLHQVENVQSQVKNAHPPAQSYLSLKEFVGDETAAGLKSTSLGNTKLESPTLVSALQRGEMLAIAYGRYQADVGAPDSKGNRPLIFTRLSQHKVAVSGFRPGTYPVVINDVGDGKRHLVRVTTDWRSLTYTVKDSAGKVTTIDSSKLVVGPKFEGRSLIVYEGAEDITVGERHRQALFLDESTTLSVP